MSPLPMDPNSSPEAARASTALGDRSGRMSPAEPSQSLLGAFANTCRFDAALAATMPVVVVSACAWWQTGAINWLALIFCAMAAFTAALGAHLLSEYQDRTRAAAPAVQEALQLAGQRRIRSRAELHRGEIRSLGYIALLLSLLCSLWLGLLVGWPMLLFGGVALLLAWSYAGWPLRYARWGFGLGESGLFLGLGLIPAVAAYYAQVEILTPLALWSSLPFALLGSLVVMADTLRTDRRDWLIGKRTLAVTLGRSRAIDFSSVLLISAFAFIILAAVVTELPLRTMIALLGLPVATSAYAALDREQLPAPQANRLHTAAIHATLATALLYCLALLTSRLW